jgi:hypothetical protein
MAWDSRIPGADVAALSAVLRTAGSAATLRPIQAAALLEAVETEGRAFVNARMGAGKTLTAALLPVVLRAKRPLILVPGGLVKKTRDEFAEYRKDWRLPVMYELRGYEALGTKKQADFLSEYRPDLIVADEADKLARVRKASRARRVARYMCEAPDTKFVALTATFFKSSFLDFAHLLAWSMRDLCCFPLNDITWSRWAAVLDRDETRPGVSLAKWHQWIDTCPGVIISQDTFDGELDVAHVAAAPAAPKQIEGVRRHKVRPDGLELFIEKKDDSLKEHGASVANVIRQLALGFYYRPDPRPPKGWVESRLRYVRRVNARIEQGWGDTELQIREILEAEGCPILAAWQKAQRAFSPSYVPEWIDDHAINYARTWGRDGGIIWTPYHAFGRRLSECSGWPYFGQGGLSPSGESIEEYQGQTVIASVRANSTGRNLQRWCRNLIVSPPSNGRDLEQLIARTYRDGQTRKVLVDILLACPEAKTALNTCYDLAEREGSILRRPSILTR